MATSIKKRGYLVALAVSAIVLALYSSAWSQDGERLMSYMSDAYLLGLDLNPVVVTTYVEQINAEYELNLVEYPSPLGGASGVLIIHDRYNVRDDHGEFLLPGTEFATILFLPVIDPRAPYGVSFLQVKTFNSNQNSINHLINKGLLDPEHYTSEIKVTHVAKQNEENIINDHIKVTEDRNKIQFGAKFTPPDPYGEPSLIPPEGPPVGEHPATIRFCYDPTRLFKLSLSRAVWELPVVEVEFMLKIDLSDPDEETLADEIFNSVRKKDVFGFSYMRQIVVADEITN
jgi:hypothetical protein